MDEWEDRTCGKGGGGKDLVCGAGLQYPRGPLDLRDGDRHPSDERVAHQSQRRLPKPVGSPRSERRHARGYTATLHPLLLRLLLRGVLLY